MRNRCQIGVRTSYVYLGWLAGLAADTAVAEQHLATADQIRFTDEGKHLSSLGGSGGRSGWPGPGGPARPKI